MSRFAYCQQQLDNFQIIKFSRSVNYIFLVLKLYFVIYRPISQGNKLQLVEEYYMLYYCIIRHYSNSLKSLNILVFFSKIGKMKSHVTKSSLLKNYGELDYKTLQKERYILKTSLQGSLGRKKVSQIEISLKNQRRGGGEGGGGICPLPQWGIGLIV